MQIEEALPQVRVTKKADDPDGIVRVSIGNVPVTPLLPAGGYYVVYRGAKEQAIAALKVALMAMEAAAAHLGPGQEPSVQPDDGKRYA